MTETARGKRNVSSVSGDGFKVRHRAGIVGLGQVGLLFDDDPKRSGIWTHFAAYETLADMFDLVAVADPDADRRHRAERRKSGLRSYRSLEDMLNAEQLEVVSICTPSECHTQNIEAAAGRVPALICEKPLGNGDLEACRRSVLACKQKRTVLAVNYHRRFAGYVPFVQQLLSAGDIGDLRNASAMYTGPLDAVGSHAIDLVHFLAGALTLRSVVRGPEDRFTATLHTAENALVSVHCVGPREDFVFEVDLLGSAGRLRLVDDFAAVQRFHFQPSLRYGTYRELFAAPSTQVPTDERFLPLFRQVAALLEKTSTALTSDGESALATQCTIEQIRQSLSQ